MNIEKKKKKEEAYNRYLSERMKNAYNDLIESCEKSTDCGKCCFYNDEYYKACTLSIDNQIPASWIKK